MSTPILYPPVQPGVCDAGATYTVVVLARQASVLSLGGGFAFDALSAPGGYLYLHAEDGVGSGGATPGDMALRLQVTAFDLPWFDADRTYSIPLIMSDNAGNEATATQTVVVRKWTFASATLTYTPSGFVTTASVTFGLTGHGLSAGDRVYITAVRNPAAVTGPLAPVPIFATVTAVPDGNHFTATQISGYTDPATWLGEGFSTLADTGGTPDFIYTLAGKQTGTTQNDITSVATVTGTRGVALSYTIATAAVGGITAAGVPDGVGIAGTLLSGTPVASGWYPVVLTAGTMQRLCLFTIAPGSYDDLLTAPGTVNAVAGRTIATVVTAPSLTGLSTAWVVANAPEGITLTGTTSTQAIISGAFSDPGTYALVVTAAAGTINVSKTVTFIVTAGQPVINNPGPLTVGEADAVNIRLTATNAPTSWALTSGPAWLGIDASGNLTGTPGGAGVFAISATATNAAGTSDPGTFLLTVAALANYLPWLHGDLSLTDVQFDLRMRGVQSFYAQGGAIGLMESDTCKLAVVLLSGGTVLADATTLWLTARTDADGAPVIDLAASGAGALRTITGGSYYLLTVNLSADPILDAINDLDDPGGGAPAVLTLHAQLAVLRASGQVARSQPFTLTIAQRLADAGLPPLNQY